MSDAKDRRDQTVPTPLQGSPDVREWKAQRAQDGLPTAGLDYEKAYKQRYRALHADHIAAYRVRYREENGQNRRAQDRERLRADAEKAGQVEARRLRRAERDHAYYLAHQDQWREYTQRSREKKKVQDPEGFREAHNKGARDDYRRHHEERLQHARDAHRDNPGAQRAYVADYYERNKEQIKAKRRARYAANSEREKERMRGWHRRERNRIQGGLPLQCLHRTTSLERDANLTAASEFFTRLRSPEQVQALREERVAPAAEELAAWKRDCDRTRAEIYIASAPDVSFRFHTSEERQLVKELQAQRRAAHKAAAVAAEDARLDAIARAINDRLRQQASARTPGHPDPARRITGPRITQTGMGL